MIERKLLLGDEAIALGAIHAGISGAGLWLAVITIPEEQLNLRTANESMGVGTSSG